MRETSPTCGRLGGVVRISRMSRNGSYVGNRRTPTAPRQKNDGCAIRGARLRRQSVGLHFVISSAHRPRWLGFAVAVSFATLAAALPASADQEHTVRAGQSLGAIAKKYGVSVFALASHNRIKRDASLRPGQVLSVPAQGIVYVTSGQSLASIARMHHVDAGELAKRNGLKPKAPLQRGQRLILPGFDEGGEASEARKRWGAPKQLGLVTVYRIWSKQTRRIRIRDGRGRVRPEAVRQMREVMRPRESRRRKDPHPRLLRLLAQVSDHFGGRPIHIVSGVRPPGGYTRETSRHVAGEAIDFRIPGVPLTDLRDYCQRFDHSGCGYYPRSRFVHMDVRRTSARWTDWSLPGQAPMLQPPGPSADGPEGLDTDTDAPPEPANDAELPEAPPAADDGLAPIDDEPL